MNKQGAIDFLEKTKAEITTKHEHVFVEENFSLFAVRDDVDFFAGPPIAMEAIKNSNRG